MIDYGLAGRVVLVTGVSRRIGIGAAIARAFAEAGATVVTTYYRPYDEVMPWRSSPDEAEEIVDELKSLGVQAAGIEADLSDPEVPIALFDQIESMFGHVDILINNAAHDQGCAIYSLRTPELDKHYAVNVRGAALLCAELARRHDGRAGGRIVNLTSGQMLVPMPENVAYAATKGAVEALTFSLSASLAEKGITVNAVDPGPTDTGWISGEIRSALLERAPFGRVGTPEDAANVVLFLASSRGQWITGQVIRSRGGL